MQDTLRWRLGVPSQNRADQTWKCPPSPNGCPGEHSKGTSTLETSTMLSVRTCWAAVGVPHPRTEAVTLPGSRASPGPDLPGQRCFSPGPSGSPHFRQTRACSLLRPISTCLPRHRCAQETNPV